jgi:hypothetical protein
MRKKAEKPKVVYIRMPLNLKNQLDAICDQEQVSLNRLSLSIMAAFVKSYAAKQQNT